MLSQSGDATEQVRDDQTLIPKAQKATSQARMAASLSMEELHQDCDFRSTTMKLGDHKVVWYASDKLHRDEASLNTPAQHAPQAWRF